MIRINYIKMSISELGILKEKYSSDWIDAQDIFNVDERIACRTKIEAELDKIDTALALNIIDNLSKY